MNPPCDPHDRDRAPERVAALLAEGLAELDQPGALAAPLAELCQLLERWAARMSLTAHRDAETIARRLVLDALALSTRLPQVPALADLGSGAGFPGIPLALVRPDCRVTLVESRERRVHFQRAAIRALGLANVRALHGRAEALPAEPQPLALAQAMAEPGQTARWLAAWVSPGGWVAIPGGAEAPRVPSLSGFTEERVRHYRVPLGGPTRTLWLARRDV